MLKKIVIGISLLTLLAPFTSLAQTSVTPGGNPGSTTVTPGGNPGSTTVTPGGTPQGQVVNPLARLRINDLMDLVNWVISFLVGAVAFVAIIAIMLAGYQMIFGSGNSEQIQAAKNRIQWSLIGLITVLVAYTIVRVVINIFTKQ